MKRPPTFRVIKAAHDRQWVRLKGGNNRTVATTETYRTPASAQNAIKVARVAVATELAEALRAQDYPDAAALLVPLAKTLPPVEVESVVPMQRDPNPLVQDVWE